MAKLLKALAVLAGWLLLAATAQAALVTYTITVASPVFNSSGDSIGGPGSPLIFEFVVDSAAPNVWTPDSSTGLYESSYETLLSYNSLTLDGSTTNFGIGSVAIRDAPGNDFFIANGQYAVPGSLIDGRAVYTTSVFLLSDSDSMFSDTTLPLDASFASEISSVAIWVYFYPKVGDPEFGNNEWVNFSGPVSPDAVTVQVAVVPEPSTYALMLAGLGAVAFAAKRRRVPAAQLTA